MTPKWQRKERDASEDKFAWALSNKPGANVVNGSWRRRVAERSRAMHKRVHTYAASYGSGNKVNARYTPPGYMKVRQQEDSDE
jgi:hypothetical protein